MHDIYLQWVTAKVRFKTILLPPEKSKIHPNHPDFLHNIQITGSRTCPCPPRN